MGTGSSRIPSLGRRGRRRLDARLKDGRKLRMRWLETEALESRTLLATTPAPTASGAAVNLTNLGSVTGGGNANSPTVEIDPYNPNVVFAVWGVDLSSLTTVPHTNAIVEGAYSTNAGTSWDEIGDTGATSGESVTTPFDSFSPALTDPLTINASGGPTAYTQVTDPSVAFDARGDAYVLTLQTSGASDGALVLTEFNFSGGSPVQVKLPNDGIIYQWVTGSDAATDPALAIDAAPSANTATPDDYADNVYVAWSSIDVEPANPNPYSGTGFNPNRAELVVGTPVPGGTESKPTNAMAFGGVQTVNVGGNFGPQDDAHPQLVIDQNDGGQVTVAWDDFGSGATASPPFDELMSNLVAPGDSYGFAGGTGPINPATSSNNVTTPVTTTFTDSVSIPAAQLANLDDLTVSLALTDQESVQNLNVTLIAPDGTSQITLFNNQDNAAGTASTGTGLPGGNAVGVYGFTTGQTGTPGTVVGTEFDDNATRDIFDSTTGGTNGNSATDYIGYFQPEFGSLKALIQQLEQEDQETGLDFIDGPWTLAVTNFTASTQSNVANQGQVKEFSLQFSTGMTQPGSPTLIDTTLVRGAIGNSYSDAVPASPNGVGPGLVMAIDNTLGADSPFQGRIYAAFVVYEDDAAPNQYTNPTTNTDIELAYSDDGGQSWTIDDNFVNDDSADSDGYSGSAIGSSSAYVFGRTQFQPEIAVDQATGTLVVSWRDARNDAADARVATYLTTSIDGGNTFSAQSYANPSQTATDAITGATDIIGPEPDNQSSGNPQTDKTFGYGDQMGLAVFDGQVYPIWAGNLNQSYLTNGTTVVADPLDIWYRPMVIAAGPRIIDSTMGPITYSEASVGSVTIEVDFDRPVIASTFVKADVQVYYHDTNANDPFVSLIVTGVAPIGGTNTGLDPDAYTSFLITFNPLPNGADAATYNYTGTYSYLITPDNGSGVVISSPVGAYVGSTYRADDPDDQNADGVSDENPLTMPDGFAGTTPGDVYVAPTPSPSESSLSFEGFIENGSPIVYVYSSMTGLAVGEQVSGTGIPNGATIVAVDDTDFTITLSVNATSNEFEDLTATSEPIFKRAAYTGGTNQGDYILTPPYVGTTLPIIVPGPQVLSTSVPGGTQSAGNLVVDGTASTMNVTFDRPMQVSTFTPSEVQEITGPTGSLSAPQNFSSTATSPQSIPAATGATAPGVLDSTITIPSYDGTFSIADITVSLSVAIAPDSDLTATLIAPDGTSVVLFSNVGGSGSGFVNTVLDDSAINSITGGSAPFTGSYQPQESLSALFGHLVDATNPADASLFIPGVWTLQLSNAGTGVAGMLDTWALNIAPAITVTPNPATETTVSGVSLDTEFTIGFPLQQLSGTYTIQLGPNILDQFGEGLDTNQVAGLDVLEDKDQDGATTTVHYPAGSVPEPVSQTTTSTITVPDSFLISGDQTASEASVMQVQLNISYPNDPDLTATLTHYGPGGNEEGSVILFSGVGAGTTTANFDSTVLDDNASVPIQDGAAPFFSTYSPQESLATAFAPADGQDVQGTWVLTITNSSTSGTTGTLNGWSLTFQRPLPDTGLGEPGSDDYTASFRLFNLGQTDSVSSEQWTPVGPASIGGGSTGNADPSGRVTGLAIDPSDPSGNTVYAAGASGGVWKTSDFLTTNPAGPTWIPLTNFGPTNAVNIGGIAVFPQNDNPNDSIIIAATGEGDTGTAGVGFLISTDGGATWNLADSTDNVDANGNWLPISSTGRNREFVGDSAYAVVVDPKATPTGGVIIYAALSGPTGGIWRSENTGETWTQVLAGQATSVALDQDSYAQLDPDTDTYIDGNLQVVYAAIRGQGVYMSPNQGQVWEEMLGGVGNPLIFNEVKTPYTNVNPANGPTPNGGQGRITLAVPASTGNIAEDAVYSGWLYALVSTPGGSLYGIFVTKDFGQNWTEVNIPTDPNEGYLSNPAIPTNDLTQSNYSVIGSTQFPQGNYNQAIAVDPVDPSVIYVGGTADGNQSAFIRIDLTDIWDAHNLTASSSDSNDGGKVTLSSTGPATINLQYLASLYPESYLNLIRNPGSPFVADSTVVVYDYTGLTNNGAGVEWIPFDLGGTDYHRIITTIDPTTGLPRIIAGDDQGIWTALDDNGTFLTSIGESDAEPSVSRNGNLQITQFYYGAAQPSTAAALVAGALFYGSAQDNGGPYSDPDVINDGDIVYTGPGGDASGVATDQQGNGTIYQYFWPCCGGNYTDFFTVNGVGETYGLLQASGGDPTPDPQWPYLGGANFAVNPVNGQDIVISSAVGRIFTTTNGGVDWFDVGDPTVFSSPGTFSVALAYGAPDPTAPSGVGNLGNFIYVGTAKGQIYVTQDGGGSGTGNDWINISTGLDGSAVQQIITDPTRGSHDAYAVTSAGVYYIANSIPSSTNPTPTWVNITGNLKSLAYSIFGQEYNPATDPNAEPYDLAISLSSITADWRYAIPNDPTDPTQGYHPVLYVGANSGVFVSYNEGKTWSLFPSTTYGALAAGGDLPHVSVTSLSLSLGDISVSTGMPTLDGPDAPSAIDRTANESSADPDVLMASTYGQGEFAINLAPLILVDPTTNQEISVTGPGVSAGNAGSDDLPAVTGSITISGTSEVTDFGNATWVTVEDITNPADPVVIAGFNPADAIPTPSASNSTNALGQFAIPFNPETYYGVHSSGVHTIEVFATDNAGAVGNVVTYSFYLNPPTQLQFAVEPPATGTAGVNFAGPLPSVPNIVVDVEDAAGNVVDNFSGPVTIQLANDATGSFDDTSMLTVDAVDGVATFGSLVIDTAGTYELEATNPNLTSGTSTAITINPNVAAKLFWSTEPPGTVTEGEPFSGSLEIEDAYGNLETTASQGVTISLDHNGSADAADLGGTTSATTSGGVATFSNIIINNIGQPYTLVAQSGGLTEAISSAIDSVAPTLVSGNLSGGGSGVTSTSTTAGTAFPLTWTALDNSGAVDTYFNGTVTLSIYSGPSGATLLGTTTATATNGIATFSGVVLDKAGAYVLQASSGNLTPGDINVTVNAAAASGLLITTEPPSGVQAGTGFGFSVEAEDQYGNPTALTGTVGVTISTNPGNSTLGGSTTVIAGNNGIATFSGLTLNKTGTGYVLRVTSTGLTAATTTPITVTPATMTQLVIPANGEPPATLDAGNTFSITVDAEDQFGNIVTGFGGSVSITSPSVLLGTKTLDATQGVATFTGLSIDTVGTYELLVTTGTTSVTSGIVTVVANPTPGKLYWADEPPGSVVTGAGFGAKIEVEDAYGNLESGYNGSVSIALDANPGSATLGGTTTVTASDGTATFSGLTLNSIANGYTLQASIASPAVTSPASSAIDVTPILPVGLVVTTQPPSSVQVAAPFGLTVDVIDQAGGPDPQFDGSVSVAISGPPGSATLSGTTTVTASDGVATFSGLSLSALGDYTLQVSSSDLTSITTDAIDVVAGPATKLVVIDQPPSSGVTAGVAFPIEVEAEDQYGNQASSFDGTLTASLSPNPGNATLGGVDTATAVNGLATFTGLAVGQEGTGYTISVAGNGVTSATSDPFNVTASTATQLLVSTSPPASVTAGSAFGFSVEVADAYGNVETSFNGLVSIRLSAAPGGGSLIGTTTAVAKNGVASFAGLSLDKAATGYTIQATATGLMPATTGSIAVTAAAPAKLVVLVPPPTTVSAGSEFGLSVEAEDAYGNPATQFSGSVTIGLSNDPGGAPLSGAGPFTVTASGGVASFPANALALDVAQSGYTLQASSAGLTPATTAALDVVAGQATHLVVVSEPPSIVLTGNSFGLTVEAEDTYGNVATTFSGPIIVAAPAGSGASLSGSTSVSASQGVSTFTGLVLAQANSPIALPVSAAGLTGTATTPVAETTPAVLAFSTGTVIVSEDSGQATIQVERTGGYQGAVSVQVATSGGTAVAGVNYTAINQTLQFAAGQDSLTVTIPVLNAGKLSSNPTIGLVLSNPGASANLGSQAAATVQILNAGQTTSQPPVSVEGVQVVRNKRHQVTGIVVTFTGALNASEASNIGEYSLVQAGKKNSFTARGAKAIKLASAAYNAANDTVTLTTRKKLVVHKPLQLTVDGTPPAGLEDSTGRSISGNAVAVITRTGVTVSALSVESAAVDELVALGELTPLAKVRKK